MKRSHRLVALTNYFLENPNIQESLTYFSKRFGVGKASISEDLDIVDEVFRQIGQGYLNRVAGSSGGVSFIPKVPEKDGEQFIAALCKRLEDPARVLPGGYLYMSDLLGEPSTIRNIGRLFASQFSDLELDAVITVETKGIPLAYAVASFLEVPVVTVRRDPKVTEGTSVSINYVSGSSRKIQSMVLAKRSLKEGANVCIIDDFMKAGGTISGMVSLLEEFQANVKAIGVLAEADDEEDERMVEDYLSLVKISNVDMKTKQIEVIPGSYQK